MGEKISGGAGGTVEFSEFGFGDFRDVEVIVFRVVGDIPGSVEDFGLETLDALEVGWLC